MGVFGFIKGIKAVFAGKPGIAEEVSMEGIDEWFSSRYSSRQDFLKGQIEGIRARVAEQIASARQNIESLGNAQLRNPNIPEKAKHYMEGNREAYIKRTEQFLCQLSIPDDSALLRNFITGFDSRVEEFGKSTARSYAIMKEFFEEEVSRIAANIRDIDKLVREIKDAAKNSRINEMDRIRHDIARLKNKISHKAFLEQEIRKKEAQINELEKEKARAEHSVAGMEGSREYRDYNMLKHKIGEARKESAEKESEIAHIFASLERPMRKYLRIVYSDRDLLQKYIESPVKALTEDFSLKIVALLENMKKAILDDTIELKDRQKIRVVEEIKELSKEYLSRFLSEYGKLRKRESELLKEIRSMTVADRLKNARERLKISGAMLDKARKDMEGLDSELGKIDIQSMKKELSEKIKSGIDVKVVIS